jgi:hypothetical protein
MHELCVLMDYHNCLHGGIVMVNIYGSDIPNLSKFVEDTIEAIDVYGTGIYDDDEDSVEE